jgi:hypothetical protein
MDEIFPFSRFRILETVGGQARAACCSQGLSLLSRR